MVVVNPGRGDAVEMLLERAGNDAVVRLIGVKSAWITASQLQGRGGFPAVDEAVESFQGFDAAVGAELGDESAAADALKLARIADEGEPPAVSVGEDDELVEGGCREHAGFVDDQCRAGRKLELGRWWPVGALPFVKQLGDGVGGNAGVALDRSGRLRGRCDGEHDPAVCVKIVGSGGEHAGLAGAGGPDDEDEPIVAGDGRCGIGLQRVETVLVDGGGGCGRAGLGGHRPRHDRFLLSEHRPRREPGRGRFDPHRPAIRHPPGRVAWWVEVDELGEHVVGGTFERGRPAASRHLPHGALPVADRLQRVGPCPRRPLLRHGIDHVRDDDHRGLGGVGGGFVDAGLEQIDGPACGGGLGLPPCRQFGGTVTGLAGPCVTGCFTSQRSTLPP